MKLPLKIVRERVVTLEAQTRTNQPKMTAILRTLNTRNRRFLAHADLRNDINSFQMGGIDAQDENQKDWM